MKAKHFYQKSYAEYYKSIELNSAGKYGEQVARLEGSKEYLKQAQESSIMKYLPQPFQSDIKVISSILYLDSLDFFGTCRHHFAESNQGQ